MELKWGHVGLNVRELARSKAFYSAVFGLEVVHERHEAGRDYAFLSNDAGVLLTLWQQSEGEFSASTPGLHHLAFGAPNMESLREFEASAQGAGARFVHQNHIVGDGEGFGSNSLYFLDPDGIRLEISVGSSEEMSAPTPGFTACGFF